MATLFGSPISVLILVIWTSGEIFGKISTDFDCTYPCHCDRRPIHPVCAVNGRTFPNHCFLDLFNKNGIRKGIHLRKKHDGPCHKYGSLHEHDHVPKHRPAEYNYVYNQILEDELSAGNDGSDDSLHVYPNPSPNKHQKHYEPDSHSPSFSESSYKSVNFHHRPSSYIGQNMNSPSHHGPPSVNGPNHSPYSYHGLSPHKVQSNSSPKYYNKPYVYKGHSSNYPGLSHGSSSFYNNDEKGMGILTNYNHPSSYNGQGYNSENSYIGSPNQPSFNYGPLTPPSPSHGYEQDGSYYNNINPYNYQVYNDTTYVTQPVVVSTSRPQVTTPASVNSPIPTFEIPPPYQPMGGSSLLVQAALQPPTRPTCPPINPPLITIIDPPPRTTTTPQPTTVTQLYSAANYTDMQVYAGWPPANDSSTPIAIYVPMYSSLNYSYVVVPEIPPLTTTQSPSVNK